MRTHDIWFLLVISGFCVQLRLVGGRSGFIICTDGCNLQIILQITKKKGLRANQPEEKRIDNSSVAV